ncbi:MAG: cell division protein ZapA [Pseudomonadota bacterium]|jgi:cell division protein ZapA|uniref:cell division protein ZapA n=1 Tax=Sulfuricystis thermophila TaxID=2496847 RepID=UPI001036D696|nr:cell division protein ZapA [Sulfuricystis thermophila]MDI6748852.1 cell division protein ZapA [Rhodocyclaceae bacterium]
MTTTLDIRIQGRDYRVACAPEEIDALQAAAALLDARMGEIAKATRSTGERLAVMTALNLAAELNAARQNATLQPSDQAIDAAESLRRIQAIEARLDEALAPQEKLF